MSEQNFHTRIAQSRKHQKALYAIYKSTIGLVNELKIRSKKYMGQVADIDQGFSNDLTSTQEQINKNVKKLTENIATFNLQIGEKSEEFSNELNAYLDHLDSAIKFYAGKEGELSDLLKSRRELLFLEALLRKFKIKINSLQLMNNALFSFSQEMKAVKDAYKSNLINVSTLITQALEECLSRIEKIENAE